MDLFFAASVDSKYEFAGNCNMIFEFTYWWLKSNFLYPSSSILVLERFAHTKIERVQVLEQWKQLVDNVTQLYIYILVVTCSVFCTAVCLKSTYVYYILQYIAILLRTLCNNNNNNICGCNNNTNNNLFIAIYWGCNILLNNTEINTTIIPNHGNLAKKCNNNSSSSSQ